MFGLFIALALAAGLFLGCIYFAGLWLTIRQLQRTSRPGALLLCSFAIRASIVLTGFFLVSRGQWPAVVACLIGFLIARTFMLRVLSMPREGVGGARQVSLVVQKPNS